MTEYLLIGIMLGLSAGFSPGPLLALVISETLQHGTMAGVKVALAPVITDLPIILLTIYIMSGLSGFPYGLGIISLAGGIFVLITGYENIRAKALTIATENMVPRSLRKGIVVNLLSPHPYLFWVTVGTPAMSRALNSGIMAVVAFIGGFYLALVGSKILLAMAAGKSRTFLSGNIYIYTMRFLGVTLCLFALFLFRDGLKLLRLM